MSPTSRRSVVRAALLAVAAASFAPAAFAAPPEHRFEPLNLDADANYLHASNGGYSYAGGAFWRPRVRALLHPGPTTLNLAPRLGVEFSKNAQNRTPLPLFIVGLEPEFEYKSLLAAPDLGLAYIRQDQDEGTSFLFGGQLAWRPERGVILSFIERVFVRYDHFTTHTKGDLVTLGVGLSFHRSSQGASE